MSNKREYKIGDTVQMGLVTLVCEEDTNNNCCCGGCYFIDSPIDIHCADIKCDRRVRTDKKDVIFKLREELITKESIQYLKDNSHSMGLFGFIYYFYLIINNR